MLLVFKPRRTGLEPVNYVSSRAADAFRVTWFERGLDREGLGGSVTGTGQGVIRAGKKTPSLANYPSVMVIRQTLQKIHPLQNVKS